jgi:ABC-type multidrug transport system ATPase subunit
VADHAATPDPSRAGPASPGLRSAGSAATGATREGGADRARRRASEASANNTAVTSAGLSKRFRRQLAVDSVDLSVPAGSVYGFLGPNGSGKTTTIRMLLGLIRPTAGSHTLLGRPMPADAEAVLPRVGALVEGPAFHPYLSGRANLLRLDAATKRYRAYSLGMRQRLALAATMLMPRDLLILDEPTNGLDPQGTREVRSIISSLAADGATVMLSTHLLSEVEQICTHVGVMHQGRLVAQAPLAQLRAQTVPRVRVTTDRPGDAAQVLTGLGVTDVQTVRDGVEGLPQAVAPEKIVAALVQDGVPVRGFAVVMPDLEEMFVSLTGEGFDVSG